MLIAITTSPVIVCVGGVTTVGHVGQSVGGGVVGHSVGVVQVQSGHSVVAIVVTGGHSVGVLVVGQGSGSGSVGHSPGGAV